MTLPTGTAPPEHPGGWGRRWLWAAILALAFLLRIAGRCFEDHAQLWTDGYRFYFELAESLAQGRGYFYRGATTGVRVPLYPMFIAAVTQGRENFWGLLLAQAVVSTGTVACAALIAYRLFDRKAAVLAALVTAIYPYYVRHDTALQETGLFTFLTAVSMLALLEARRRISVPVACGAGLALGLAILTRPTLVAFAGCAIAWLSLPERGEPLLNRRLRGAIACLGVMALVLAPWLIRQHRVIGRWALGTEFGRSLFNGNNAATFSHYPLGSIDRSHRVALAALTPQDRAELAALGSSEVARSDWFRRRGLEYIQDHPGKFAINAIRKNLAAFGPIPSPRHGFWADLVLGSAYGSVLILGILGIWRQRHHWRTLLLFYAQFLTLAALTGVLWGHSSHRSFLDVYLIVFACGFLAQVIPADRWGWLAGAGNQGSLSPNGANKEGGGPVWS